MSAILYSAPEENYLDHILKCQDKFEIIFPSYLSTVKRILQLDANDELLKDCFLKMVLYHDIGKLTKKWQEKVGTGKNLPSHAIIGAAYMWKILPDALKEPISFAVAIHHTDRGLLGDNIERPDVQAILDGIVKTDGRLDWDEKAFNLDTKFFLDDAREITVNDLKEMARCLRVWARGCGLREQHKRRLQASLAHHILKLCDISAATERNEYQKEGNTDYYGGWLMVENIRKYVDNILKRGI